MTKTESELLFDELLIINREINADYKTKSLTKDLRDIKILHDSIFKQRRFKTLDFLKTYKSIIVKTIESSQNDCQTKLNQMELICRFLIQPKFARTLKAYMKVLGKYKRKINEVLYNEYDWDESIKDSHKLTANDKQRALIGLYTLLPPRNSFDISLLTLISDEAKMNPDLNYIVINKVGNPTKLVYMNYDTNETYNTVQLMVGETLRAILKKHIKTNNIQFDTPLFSDDEGGYHSPDAFSKFVLDTFSKVSCMALTDKILIKSYIDMILKLDLSNKLIFTIERQMSRKLR
jgi:hypothetical protein